MKNTQKVSKSRKDLSNLKLAIDNPGTTTSNADSTAPARKTSNQRATTQIGTSTPLQKQNRAITESSSSSSNAPKVNSTKVLPDLQNDDKQYILSSFKDSSNIKQPVKRKTTIGPDNTNNVIHFNSSNKTAQGNANTNRDSNKTFLKRNSFNVGNDKILLKTKDTKVKPLLKPISFAISQGGLDYNGKVKQNQDNYILLKNVFGLDFLDFFGVFDGHGINGHHVSALVKKTLNDYFTNDKTYSQDKGEDNKMTTIYNSLSKKNHKAFKAVFDLCEKNALKEKCDTHFSGSTCVFVSRISNHLLTANIGDSRAIIVYKDETSYNVEALTQDHKPELPEEKKRIESKGGLVLPHEDDKDDPEAIMRVWVKGEKFPGIAISRTIGDEVAKSVGVINTPDVLEKELKGQEAFVVVASDGIWEFLSNEKVMNIVVPFYEKKDVKGAVEKLVKDATSLWEKDGNARDDITCIVYFFEDN